MKVGRHWPQRLCCGQAGPSPVRVIISPRRRLPAPLFNLRKAVTVMRQPGNCEEAPRVTLKLCSSEPQETRSILARKVALLVIHMV